MNASPYTSYEMISEHVQAIQRLGKGLHIVQEWEARVGQTPHQVVYQEGPMKLLHYKPEGKPVCSVPLLIVFSLINRSYILDLKPGKSIVELFVKAGFEVYLIDWGTPGRSDQFLTLDDYVNRFMRRMVEFIRDHSGSKTVSILGYCMGGTMSAMFAAMHPKLVENLILMAAPFDFEKDDGLLKLWADKDHFNVDKLVDSMGNIPPWFLQSAFTMLKPMQNLVDKYVKFYEKMEDKQFVDDFLTLEYWLNDNIPLAGEVYRQFVKDLYQDNLLIKNKLRLGDKTVNLKDITCPVMTIVADHDHLVPPQASTPLHTLLEHKNHKIVSFPAGHIGLSVSGKAMKQLWPGVIDWVHSNCK